MFLPKIIIVKSQVVTFFPKVVVTNQVTTHVVGPTFYENDVHHVDDDTMAGKRNA